MPFEEQIRLKLEALIARDGYVSVEHFAKWCVDKALADAPKWPKRDTLEAILNSAFVNFVEKAIEDADMEADEEDEPIDSVFIRGKGEEFHEYVVRRGDETGTKLAQAHREAQNEAA